MAQRTEEVPTVPFIPGVEPPENWTPAFYGNRWEEPSNKTSVVGNDGSRKTDGSDKSN